MGKGTELTWDEMCSIEAMHKCNLSARKIAIQIGRDRRTVDRYLKRGKYVKSRPRPGGPAYFDDHGKRRVWREASNKGSNASQINAALSLTCSPRTTLRCIHSNPNLVFKRMLTRPHLTEQHKVARVAWALPRLVWNEEWHHMVFSDEKKFNCDGPDGWAHYWHDIRKSEEIFSKRPNGGGSVIIWAAFGYNGVSPIIFIDGKMNSEKYCTMLRDKFTPYFHGCAEPPAVFQQDNASVHVSKYASEWLNEHFVWERDWPAKSPDLNPIENLWGILSRRVYMNCKHYNSVTELKEAIILEWASITLETRRNLIDSMPLRLVDVISTNGAILNV